MDIEQKQAEHIDYFVKQATNQKGPALASVITEATSHPSLIAFSEILSVPTVLEVSNCALPAPFAYNYMFICGIRRQPVVVFFLVICCFFFFF